MTEITKTAETLLALAERVEAAAGPDRELDCLLYEMDDLRPHGLRKNLTPEMRGTYYGEPTGRYFDVTGSEPVELPYIAPAYTASLDAAMTLVPDVPAWHGDMHWSHNNARERVVVVHLRYWRVSGRGCTPALALTAAALRAIAVNHEASL